MVNNAYHKYYSGCHGNALEKYGTSIAKLHGTYINNIFLFFPLTIEHTYERFVITAIKEPFFIVKLQSFH